MIKTMLLPVMSDPTDGASFSIAASAAQTLGAHIEFLYARTDPAAILVAAGGADLSPNLNAVALLEEIEKGERERAARARHRAEAFCERHGIAIADTPPGPSGASAAWREYVGERSALLIERARFNDLVVLRGEKDVGGLLPEEIGTVMMSGGRPVLLAPQKAPSGFPGTVVIAWKNGTEAARAVSAAMPFLAKAGRILILHVDENESPEDGSLASIAEYLRWRGLEFDRATRQPERPLGARGTSGRGGGGKRRSTGHGRLRAQPHAGDGIRRLHAPRARRSKPARPDAPLRRCARATRPVAPPRGRFPPES